MVTFRGCGLGTAVELVEAQVLEACLACVGRFALIRCDNIRVLDCSESTFELKELQRRLVGRAVVSQTQNAKLYTLQEE